MPGVLEESGCAAERAIHHGSTAPFHQSQIGRAHLPPRGCSTDALGAAENCDVDVCCHLRTRQRVGRWDRGAKSPGKRLPQSDNNEVTIGHACVHIFGLTVHFGARAPNVEPCNGSVLLLQAQLVGRRLHDRWPGRLNDDCRNWLPCFGACVEAERHAQAWHRIARGARRLTNQQINTNSTFLFT
eukprot:scaffold36314_cov139-Isochrysis_galbana.AAC.4